jgi:hypothetical protein
MKNTAIAFAAAALLACPAAANVLVVRSSGPSAKTYPPGHTLPDNGQVALRSGDVITVLGGQATRTLRGPGTFPVGGGTKTATANASRRGRFSAMRSGEVPPLPSVWHIDASQSGTVCVADTGKVQLWRADAGETVSLTLQPSNGAGRTLTWAAGEDVLNWPMDLPVAQEATYELSSTANPDKTKLVFAAVGSAPADEQGLARTLIAKGCQNQLDALLETVPDEGSAGSH